MGFNQHTRGAATPLWKRPLALLAAPFILSLIVSLFAGTGLNISQAQGGAVIRCNPLVANGIVGQPLAVDIYVENVQELWAGDVQLSFDPTMAQIVDADPAASGVQIEMLDDFLSPDFVVRRIGNNTQGSIWYAASQVQNPPGQPPKSPVSGSGPLARITFEATQAGSFEMPITYQKIVKPTGDQIPATALNCQVNFVEANPDMNTYMPVVLNLR